MLRTYLKGGAGRLILISPSKQGHTYLFERPTNPAEFPPGTIFVSCIHEDHKMYIGVMENFVLRLTRSSRFLPDADVTKGAQYITYMARSQDLINNTPMLLIHTGVCCRCGRPLSQHEALLRGYGRRCGKLLNAEYI